MVETINNTKTDTMDDVMDWQHDGPSQTVQPADNQPSRRRKRSHNDFLSDIPGAFLNDEQYCNRLEALDQGPASQEMPALITRTLETYTNVVNTYKNVINKVYTFAFGVKSIAQAAVQVAGTAKRRLVSRVRILNHQRRPAPGQCSRSTPPTTSRGRQGRQGRCHQRSPPVQYTSIKAEQEALDKRNAELTRAANDMRIRIDARLAEEASKFEAARIEQEAKIAEEKRVAAEKQMAEQRLKDAQAEHQREIEARQKREEAIRHNNEMVKMFYFDAMNISREESARKTTNPDAAHPMVAKHAVVSSFEFPQTPKKKKKKKKVDFFVSPVTGGPVSRYQCFTKGEPIGYKSAPSTNSSISSFASSFLTRQLPLSPTKIDNQMMKTDFIGIYPDPTGEARDCRSISYSSVSESASVLLPIPNGQDLVRCRPALRPKSCMVTTEGSPMKIQRTSPKPAYIAADFPSIKPISMSTHPVSAKPSVDEPRPSQISAGSSEEQSTPAGIIEGFEHFSLSSRRHSVRQKDKAAEAKQLQLKLEKEAAEAEARKKQQEEEQRRKKGIRRMPTGPVIKPLSEELETKIAEAMKLPDNGIVTTTSGGTDLLRKDIGTILPQPGRDLASGWLNDEIISGYLQLVVDHGLAAAAHKRGQIPKLHTFNTFFYKNLREKGPKSVARWASRAKIGGKNLANVETIFIPVHQSAHWTLLVIRPVAKVIEYFDSLHGASTGHIKLAKAWLEHELGDWFVDKEWTVMDGGSPSQDNGKDCGVFTITTAKMIAAGLDPLCYGAADIPIQRKAIVAELKDWKLF